MSYLIELRSRLDNDKLRRLGAALWFRVGTRLYLADLSWAVPLLGEGADRLIWESLHEVSVQSMDGIVQARPLACWLEELSCDIQKIEYYPRIVWTLPERYPTLAKVEESYLNAILELFSETQKDLLIVSPFLHKQGIKYVVSSITQALNRGVRVMIITHNADDIASDQSIALEEIRKDAERLNGKFILYTANVPEGNLLHAKIVVSDEQKVIIGSANLTGPGLETNFEVGVVLGAIQAKEIARVINQLIEVGMVRKVFSTRE